MLSWLTPIRMLLLMGIVTTIAALVAFLLSDYDEADRYGSMVVCLAVGSVIGAAIERERK